MGRQKAQGERYEKILILIKECRYSIVRRKAKDALFLTATFLSRNWLLPHFLYYDKRVGNSKIPGDQAGQWKPDQCRPGQYHLGKLSVSLINWV